MLFEAKDFIYCSSKESRDSAEKRVIAKYPSFFGCDTDKEDLHIDIREIEHLKQLIATDTEAILHLVSELRRKPKEDDGKISNTQFVIRHCCDPYGAGYYAVIDTNSGNRRFVESAYELEVLGGCWSYLVWRKILTADCLLFWFLEQVKEMLLSEDTDLEMEIRHLYLPYIVLSEENTREMLQFKNRISLEYILATIEEYKQANINEFEEYSANKNEWYNSPDNNGFYAVKSILENAINGIYHQETKLKNCGMWEEAYKVKNILLDLVYKREQ